MPSMRPALIVRNHAREFTVDVKKDEITFGRDHKEAEIVIRDGLISRKHFAVRKSGDACQVIDLDSKNGTFVNGSRIKEHALRVGDVIAIGETTLTFVDRDVPTSSSEMKLPHMAVVGVSVEELNLEAVRHPKARHVAALLDVTLQVRSTPELKPAVEALLSLAIRHFEAPRAAFFLVDDRGQASLFAENSKEPGIQLEPEIVRAMLETRRGILRSSEVSVMYVPLLRGGQVWATLYMDTLHGNARLSEDDLRVACALGVAFEALTEGKE